MKPTLLTATGNPENQDRADIIDDGDRIVLCVADGAGGLSGGAEAAGMAVEFVRTHAAELNDGDSCVTVLRQMDEAIVHSAKQGFVDGPCAREIKDPRNPTHQRAAFLKPSS